MSPRLPAKVRKAGIHPVVIAMGSNIEPVRHLILALERLAARLPIRRVSRLYETTPVGDPDSPVFFNAAVLASTTLAPRALKYDVLRPLESELGRVRTENRNAPRTVDLDIVLYGSLILQDPVHRMALPDPDILRCAHLALPLADVVPDMRHPLTGETLARIAERFTGTPGVRVVPLEEVAWPPRLAER